MYTTGSEYNRIAVTNGIKTTANTKPMYTTGSGYNRIAVTNGIQTTANTKPMYTTGSGYNRIAVTNEIQSTANTKPMYTTGSGYNRTTRYEIRTPEIFDDRDGSKRVRINKARKETPDKRESAWSGTLEASVCFEYFC